MEDREQRKERRNKKGRERKDGRKEVKSKGMPMKKVTKVGMKERRIKRFLRE